MPFFSPCVNNLSIVNTHTLYFCQAYSILLFLFLEFSNYMQMKLHNFYWSIIFGYYMYIPVLQSCILSNAHKMFAVYLVPKLPHCIHGQRHHSIFTLNIFALIWMLILHPYSDLHPYSYINALFNSELLSYSVFWVNLPNFLFPLLFFCN